MGLVLGPRHRNWFEYNHKEWAMTRFFSVLIAGLVILTPALLVRSAYEQPSCSQQVDGLQHGPAKDEACLRNMADTQSHSSVQHHSSSLSLTGRALFGPARSIHMSGERAALCAGGALLLLDMTDPSSPELLGHTLAYGLAVDARLEGDYAYMLNTGGRHSLSVFDFSDPSNPVETGVIDSLHWAEDMEIVGGYAYVADDLLRIFDLSDPSEPQQVSELRLADLATRISVSDTCAYVVSVWGKFSIVDIRNPYDPFVLSQYVDTDIWDVYVDGNYAYLAALGRGLLILDVSDKSSPVLVGSCELPEPAFYVCVSDGFAYITSDYEGLQIVNVSDPTSPEFIRSLTGDVKDVYAAGGLLLVAGDSGGLSILDVTDPANPVTIANYPTRGYAHAVDMSGSLAFVAHGKAGVKVVDVSDPFHPECVGTLETGRYVHSTFASGNYVYFTESAGGLGVMDASDPTNPVLLGAADTPGSADGLWVVGDYAYVADYRALRIFDVSTPSAPHEVGACDRGADAAYTQLAVSGNYAYVPTVTGLRIIDVSDPSSPQKMGYCSVTVALGVAVLGDYAYVTTWADGLRVIDVSNPLKPFEAGSYEGLCPEMERAYAVGGHVYLTCKGYAVKVLDLSDPTNPVEIAHLSLAGSLEGIVASDGKVYVAGGDAGLYVLQFTPTAVQFSCAPPAAGEGAVRLEWTFSEGSVDQFTIERAQGESAELEQIAELYPESDGRMAFVDASVRPGLTYLYRVCGVKNDGAEVCSSRMRVYVSDPSMDLRLDVPFPNPFNPVTRIGYSVGRNCRLRAVVYDPRGALVRVIRDSWVSGGPGELLWDGRTDSGRQVASGVYYLEVVAGGKRKCEKLTFLR